MRPLLSLGFLLIAVLAAWLLFMDGEADPLEAGAPQETIEEEAREVVEVGQAEQGSREGLEDSPELEPRREGGEAVGAVEAASATLRVVVQDATDRSRIGGLEFELMPVEGDWGWDPFQITDFDGVVELTVDAGRALILESQPEARSLKTEAGEFMDPMAPYERVKRELAPLAAGETTEIVLEMVRAESKNWFRIFSAETGETVSGVSVIGGLKTEAQSDWEGFLGAKTSRSWGNGASLIFAHPEHGVARVGLHEGGSTKGAAYRVELTPTASLEVTLTRDGNPIAGQMLAVDLANYRGQPVTFHLDEVGGGHAPVPFTAETDASGVARFTQLPASELLTPFLPNASLTEVERSHPNTLTLAAGETTSLHWDLGGEQDLRGLAYAADGSPAAGREILLLSDHFYQGIEVDQVEVDWMAKNYSLEETKADASGAFVFPGLAPGRYWAALIASGQGRESTGFAQRVTIEHGVEPPVLELRLREGLSLTGMVTDPEGNGLASIMMIAVGDQGRRPDQFTTMEDGSFEVGPFLPNEKVYFTALDFGGANWALVGEPTAVAGQDTSITLVLTKGGTIAGKVVAPAEVASDNLYIQVISDSNAMMGTSLNPDGTFQWEGLAPGRWKVMAMESGGWVGITQEIVLGQGEQVTDVEVRVIKGAEVVVHNNSEHRAPFALHVDDWPYTYEVLEAGGRRTISVPAGSVQIKVNPWDDSLQEFSWSEAVKQVSAGETVTFPLLEEGSR